MGIFKEKTIIVTGASEGIGRALCLALAPQQPRLVLAARNRDRLEALKAETEALGAEAMVAPTDIGQREQCQTLIESAADRWGQIDVLINNAGMGQWTLFEEVEDPTFYEEIMRINYLGSVCCAYYALPHLRKSRGRIAAVSSALGLFTAPTHTGYCASKHAMFGFFDALRYELKPTGVTVTMIAPGFVATEIHKRALDPSGRPLAHNPVSDKKYMPPEKMARLAIKAIEKRKRLLLTAPGAGWGRFLYPALPSLIDGIIARDFKPTDAE